MKTILLLAACLLMQVSYAQTKDKVYTYDQKWNPVKEKKAVYLLHIHQTSEKNYVRTYYAMYGPRICQESFADEAGKIRNGKCAYYYANGSLDSSGEFVNDAPSGAWYYYDAEGRLINYKYYDEGILADELVFSMQEKDPPEIASTISTHDDIEASFKGNHGSWVQFLINHMRYPKRAVSASVTGTVQLQFLIDESGNIREPEIKKSVEYSLDEEALRLIQLSPPWTAATREGTCVKSFKLQPLRFDLADK